MDFSVNVNVKTNGKEQVDALERQIEQLRQTPVTVKIKTNGDSELSSLKRQISSLKNHSVNFKVNASSASGIKNIKNDFQILKNLANEISQKRIKIAGLDTNKNANQIRELSTQLSKLQSDYKVLYSTLGKNLNASQVGQLENIFGKASDRVNELNAKTKDLAENMTRASKPFNTLDASIASNKTLSWIRNNTKAAKEFGDALETLAQKQKNATSTEELRGYNKEFRNIVAQAQASGLTGKSRRDEFKRAFGQIAEFAGVYGAIQNVVFEVPRQMAQAVMDINAAQIELTKVSEASPGQLAQYWEEAAVSAEHYGASISDVISSTADWSRLGYGLEEAKKLSDATTLMQRIGDNMTQESSSEGLVSTLQGFKLEADEVNRVVDEINEVANTQPIDTAGLFAGLERSASSMSAANNTLEETIALITAGNAVLQDPERVGNGLKTISMRIRGATTELEAAGESTEGMATSTATLRKEVMALAGVDIMENETTFKSTYDILDELSEKWTGLTDIQRAKSCPYVQKCA